MDELIYRNDLYRTEPRRPPWPARAFPSVTFYLPFLRIICHASALSKRGVYDNAAWCASSIGILRCLERVGVTVEIEGIEHLRRVGGPCVIVGNHMSMLETVVLPVIVQSVRDVTFVVKQGLLEYPVFKHVMRSRNPVAVTRTNPRDDFKTVMTGGKERLDNGISIIVFPQTTRTVRFDPEQFNSIGVKLAQRAKVPILPLALKTDAWGNGKRLKDFGRIDPSKTVHIAFDEPIAPRGRGSDEHQQVVAFIQRKLGEWNGGMME